MLRIDGAYLYNLGAQIRPLRDLPSEPSPMDIIFEIVGARTAVRSFLQESIYRDGLRTVQASSEAFLAAIESIVPEEAPQGFDWSGRIQSWRMSSFRTALEKFEAVLTAELQTTALYYVSPKGGFDTACLTEHGDRLFPSDLTIKAPNAIPDVQAAARCIAFDLPTAAGFHLHRATETVLRVYFDAVAGEVNRPKTRNMGDFIKKLKELQVGDDKVIALLQSLKDHHRNPLMHPDYAIATTEEAISVYAAVRAGIGYMLDSIPACEMANIVSFQAEAC